MVIGDPANGEHLIFGQGSDDQKRDRFGAGLAVFDAQGDGIIDLLVGAPGERVRGVPEAGRIDLFEGWTGGGVAATDVWWRQGKDKLSGEPNEGDHFGGAIGG